MMMMMEAVRTSETSVDNQFTRQYNPEDSSEDDNVVMGFDAIRLAGRHRCFGETYCFYLQGGGGDAVNWRDI
jgi:hypothetical protein